MVARSLGLLAFLLLPSAALSQSNPIDGHFGIGGGCEVHRNANLPFTSDQGLLVGPNRIFGYFVECRIASVSLRSNGEGTLQLTCAGEEGEFATEATVRRSADPNRLQLQFADGAQSLDLRRCE